LLRSHTRNNREKKYKSDMCFHLRVDSSKKHLPGSAVVSYGDRRHFQRGFDDKPKPSGDGIITSYWRTDGIEHFLTHCAARVVHHRPLVGVDCLMRFRIAELNQ